MSHTHLLADRLFLILLSCCSVLRLARLRSGEFIYRSFVPNCSIDDLNFFPLSISLLIRIGLCVHIFFFIVVVTFLCDFSLVIFAQASLALCSRPFYRSDLILNYPGNENESECAQKKSKQ
jgi:hypothetical protein